MTADLAGAQAALHELAAPGVEVRTEGTVTRVVVAYRDSTGAWGGVTRQASALEFMVVFDPATGEYRIDPVERTAVVGHDSEGSFAGLSVTRTRGTVRVWQKESGTRLGEGAYDATFLSQQWEDAVIQRVEAHGWTRRRGFWKRLFG